MNIYLTYDYELFFGSPTGSIENCILYPTNELIGIGKRTKIKMLFFIDVGYIKKLKEFSYIDKVNKDYQLICNQIKDLVDAGHNCQLHIHPHWEDTIHDGNNWVTDVSRYKLADFSEDEIINIVIEYQAILQNLTKKTVTIYRAGGWCLQPFKKIQKAFELAGLKIDSTVFPGGENTKGNYYYNFKSTPDKDCWNFSNDLCVEDYSGQFTEYPIGSYNYSPLFFWRLFILGRLRPKFHKPIGDGYPMSSPGLRKEMLTKGKLLSASVDGYFVTKLNKIVKRYQKRKFDHLVVIGHPKACTKYALSQLESFIIKQKNKGNHFCDFS